MGEAVRRADHERVEGVLRVDADGLGARRRRRERRRRAASGTAAAAGGAGGVGLGSVDAQLDAQRRRRRRRVTAGADQVEEVALDPLAREVVRDGERRRCRRRARRPPTSPNQVWNVVSLSAPRRRAATSSQRLSAVSSICALHASFARSSARDSGRREHSSVRARLSMRISRPCPTSAKVARFAGKFARSTRLSTGVERTSGSRSRSRAAFHGFCHAAEPVDNRRLRTVRLYCRPRPAPMSAALFHSSSTP